MRTSSLFLLLLLGCSAGPGSVLPVPCRPLLATTPIINPFVDSVGPDAFAGTFSLIMSAKKGPQRGKSAAGTLQLSSVPVDSAGAPYHVTQLAWSGHAQIGLSEVGAAVANPGAGPAGSLDARLVLGNDGRSLGGGLGGSNPDGGHDNFTALRPSAWNDSTVVGTWVSVSYGLLHAASGTFCLRRTMDDTHG